MLVLASSQIVFGSEQCPTSGYIHYGPSRQSVPCYLVSSQYNPTLEESWGHSARTQLDHDGIKIIVDQVTDKLEYKIGERVTVKAELINIGNKNVTIVHLPPLFLTEVKYQNGSKAWPPYAEGVVLFPEMVQTLVPGIPAGDDSKHPYQDVTPIRLNAAGKYNITSLAYFGIYDNKTESTYEVVWSKPLQITVLPVKFTNAHTLSPMGQIESGIQPKDVKCWDGLVLTFKKNGLLACVKPDTVAKLVERGWGSILSYHKVGSSIANLHIVRLYTSLKSTDTPVVKVSNDLLTRFPELLNYTHKADTNYQNVQTMCLTAPSNDYCGVSGPTALLLQYNTTINQDRANQLVAGLGFNFMSVNDTTQDMHSLVISMNGHYYRIVIIGHQ